MINDIMACGVMAILLANLSVAILWLNGCLKMASRREMTVSLMAAAWPSAVWLFGYLMAAAWLSLISIVFNGLAYGIRIGGVASAAYHQCGGITLINQWRGNQ